MYALTLTDPYDTLSLTTGGLNVIEYAMRGPEARRGNQAASIATAEPPGYEDISETIVLDIRAATQSAVQDLVRRLERFGDRARRNSRRRAADTVYLTIQFDADTAAWRSELLDATVVVDAPLDHLWKLAATVQFTLTRRYYWEMAAANPTELAISTSSQGAATGGRAITHTYDQNWIQIAAAQVTGSLPAPVLLDYENDATGTQYLHTAWLVNNAHADPANVPVARTAAQMTGAGSNRWKLPAALLNASRGRYVQVIAHFSAGELNQTTTGYMEADWGGGTFRTIWTGRSEDSRPRVADLGAFPMPPGGETTGYDDVYFRIVTPNTVSHVQFLPVSSAQRVHALLSAPIDEGYEMAVDEALVVDGIVGETYTQLASGVKRPTVASGGGPLWIWPNLTQRIYLCWLGFSMAFAPTYKSRVRAWYRPRRGTL